MTVFNLSLLRSFKQWLVPPLPKIQNRLITQVKFWRRLKILSIVSTIYLWVHHNLTDKAFYHLCRSDSSWQEFNWNGDRVCLFSFLNWLWLTIKFNSSPEASLGKEREEVDTSPKYGNEPGESDRSPGHIDTNTSLPAPDNTNPGMLADFCQSLSSGS